VALIEAAEPLLGFNLLIRRFKMNLELLLEGHLASMKWGLTLTQQVLCWSGPLTSRPLHEQESGADPFDIAATNSSTKLIYDVHAGALNNGPHLEHQKEVARVHTGLPPEGV
jgi:hypothetical protein